MRHFLSLPPELHILTAQFLPICDLLHLRITCAYLHDLIPRPTHAQLLLAESTDWARAHDVYTCRYCLRLRPAAQFADRMLRRRRTRAGRDAANRFCIECGLEPRHGTARYGAGAHVSVQGSFFVVCLSCRLFRPGACDRYGRNLSICVSCWQGRLSRSGAGSPDLDLRDLRDLLLELNG